MRVRPEDVMFSTFGESMIYVWEVHSLDELVALLRSHLGGDESYESATQENVGFRYRGLDAREGWNAHTWIVTIAGKDAGHLSDSDRFEP